jgi:hypothetical protein
MAGGGVLFMLSWLCFRNFRHIIVIMSSDCSLLTQVIFSGEVGRLVVRV